MSLIKVIGLIIWMFITWASILLLIIIVFLPALPIMILAFPKMMLNPYDNSTIKDSHWSVKPYKWYFYKVWLKIIKFIGY